MKAFLLIFFCFLCSLGRSHCYGQNRKKSAPKIYPETQLGLNHFKRFTTPQGKIIDYEFVKNSRVYFLQWGTKTYLRTHPDTLTLDDAPVRNPVYIAEGKDFILMRYGCGSPCWVGLFLPMDKNKEPREIHEYQAYDLVHNLVAYFNYDSPSAEIVVENLKTGKKQRIALKSPCTSAFPGYCGSMYIKNKLLYYDWSPSAGDKPDNVSRKIKIQI